MIQQLISSLDINISIITFFQILISYSAAVFSIRSAGPEIATHQTVCKQVLGVMNHFSNELGDMLQPPTWYVIVSTCNSYYVTTSSLLSTLFNVHISILPYPLLL
jgi:hypothetical protein